MKKNNIIQLLLCFVCISMLFCVSSCNNREEPTRTPSKFNDSVSMIINLLDLDNVSNNPLFVNQPDTTSNDLYGIQVCAIRDSDTQAGYYRYAYGLFDNPNKINIKLEKGSVYSIICSVVKDGKNKIYHNNSNGVAYGYPFTKSPDNNYDIKVNANITNNFVYTRDTCMRWLTDGEVAMSPKGTYDEIPELTRLFGYIETVVPESNKEINVKMRNYSFAAKFIAEGFTTGTLDINIGGIHSINIKLPDTLAQVMLSTRDLSESEEIISNVFWKRSATDSVCICGGIGFDFYMNTLSTYKIYQNGKVQEFKDNKWINYYINK